jgi:hypothetical protein
MIFGEDMIRRGDGAEAFSGRRMQDTLIYNG